MYMQAYVCTDCVFVLLFLASAGKYFFVMMCIFIQKMYPVSSIMIHLLSSLSISITDTFKGYQYHKSLIHQYWYITCRKSLKTFHFPVLHCNFQYSLNLKISKYRELNAMVFTCVQMYFVHYLVFCEHFWFSQYFVVCSDVQVALTL